MSVRNDQPRDVSVDIYLVVVLTARFTTQLEYLSSGILTLASEHGDARLETLYLSVIQI